MSKDNYVTTHIWFWTSLVDWCCAFCGIDPWEWWDEYHCPVPPCKPRLPIVGGPSPDLIIIDDWGTDITITQELR